MIKSSIRNFLIIIIVFTYFILPSFVVKATSLMGDTSSCECTKANMEANKSCAKYCGEYSLNNIVQVGVNATQILLALSGSVALLFFIYGGVTFLISGGSAEKVTKGKTIIINAVIGLIIIFASFMIIQFSMEALGATRVGPWYQSI